MHAGDPDAHKDTCGNQGRARPLPEVQHQKSGTHKKDRKQGRDQRVKPVIEEQNGQLQTQHSNEMHRPDAAAQDNGRDYDDHLAFANGKVGCATRQGQPAERGHQRNGQRSANQKKIV